jgi:hypothetical protein
MVNSRYLTEIDEKIGRAYVQIREDIDAVKIRNTFIAIRINKVWQRGDRSILWQLEKASFPESFEFRDIIHTSQLTRAVSLPCKSAIILNKNDIMLERVANFYKSIALITANGQIEIYFNYQEALEWLDN